MGSEVEDYQFLYEHISDEPLKNRARVSLAYYIKQAVLYKRMWNVLSIMGILLPAAATLCAALGVCAGWIAAITAAITVSSGLLALFKCADKKTSYRNSAENLKSELSSYLNHTGAYTEDEQTNNKKLSDNVERIIREGYSKIAELDKQTKKD